MTYDKIVELIGTKEEYLFSHRCETILKEKLHLPGADFIDRTFIHSNRNIQTLCSLNKIFKSGRLAGTGYLSVLPVDQGVEHSAGASFSPNPMYFDPENIIKLAIEGGCNAVASTYGGLGFLSRKYAHKIPFIVKLNHNEFLTYPNKYDQILFANVDQAFEEAHRLGMVTVLWCYLRNSSFKKNKIDYAASADLTGQANYLGVTVQADIIKQKLPENNGGYKALNMDGISYGKYDERMYTELTTDNQIDQCRYQVINCFMGRAGLVNSGGASDGHKDLKEAVRTAIINKRAGGMGMLSGRKSFQKPFDEGVELLHAIQDVYLIKQIDVA